MRSVLVLSGLFLLAVLATLGGTPSQAAEPTDGWQRRESKGLVETPREAKPAVRRRFGRPWRTTQSFDSLFSNPCTEADGWISLFNGKDLTGWKLYPDPNPKQIEKVIARKAGDKVVGYDAATPDGKTVSLWQVKDGLLVGGGPASHLFTENGDYDNFHYRVEAKINDHGNSGQYFRTEFGPGFPNGYEAQINATHRDPVKTGSLYPNTGFGLNKYRDTICVLNTAPHKPDEWFTQEVIANGPEITILVNGKQTVKWTDPEYRFKKGHFALQGHDPGSVMTFRKVEYKPIAK